MASDVQGSFSFTMTAQWDYVKKQQLQKYIDNPYQISIDKRIDMKSAVEMLLSSGKWKPYSSVRDVKDMYNDSNDENNNNAFFPYSSEKMETRRPLYNEYLYFNSNIRDIIYNKIPKGFIWEKDNNSFEDNKKQWSKDARRYAEQVEAFQQPVVVLERINSNENPYYELARLSSNENTKFKTGTVSLAFYRLPITSIELRLYRTGVMLLSFRCHNENFEEKKCKGAPYTVLRVSKVFSYEAGNREQVFANNLNKGMDSNKWEPITEQSDISWIEDAARRLFLARPCYDIFQGFPDEAPLYSALCLDNDKVYTICDYRPGAAVMYPEHIAWTTDVIGSFCHSVQAAAAEPEKKENTSGKENDCQTGTQTTNAKPEKKKITSGKENAFLIINCFNDDRMHVHGTIVSKELSASICSAYGKRYEQLDKKHLGQWYGMLAADNNWKSCTCQDQTMLLDLVDRQTDGRWSERNTLYGITYHSMIQLLGPDAPPYLMTHMDWMYFQLFLIAVLQRCTVQRFYREASGLMRGNGSYDTKRGEALKSLYMLFMNQIWFNDVTEQEQGQDFFRRLQKNMDIEKDVAFLDQALNELNDQAQKKLEHIVNEQLVPLSIIGGLWGGIEMMSNIIGAKYDVPWLETIFSNIQIIGKSSVGGIASIGIVFFILYLLVKSLIIQIKKKH